MARDLTDHPLHFETQPASGAPPHAELLGTGMLVAWAATRGRLAAKHAKTAAGKQLAARQITGHAFLVGVLKGKLSEADVDGKLGAFLWGYTNRMFLDGMDHRDGKALKRLLGLGREDEIAFSDDYLATFKKAVKNPFLVPDTWQAFDRLAPILDARWTDYQKTKFAAPPPKGLYEKAVTARDAVELDVVARRAQKFTVDAGFTDQLLGIVGRSLSDRAVRDVLTVAGLPIGKRIDEQALPKFGVSYMGAKIPIGGKRELGVAHVELHANNDKSYIRGIGAEVQFARYPGALPKGIAWTDDLAKLRNKLGKPRDADTDYAHWEFPKERRRMFVMFKRKRITSIGWALPRERDDA